MFGGGAAQLLRDGDLRVALLMFALLFTGVVARGHDPFTGVHALIDSEPGGGPIIDGALHVDADVLCPRCLDWIGPLDFVRRTITDLLEHETCPPRLRR